MFASRGEFEAEVEQRVEQAQSLRRRDRQYVKIMRMVYTRYARIFNCDGQ